MLFDPRFKLGHYLLMGDQFAALGSVDAYLDKRSEIRFALRDALDRFGSEIRYAAPLRRR